MLHGPPVETRLRATKDAHELRHVAVGGAERAQRAGRAVHAVVGVVRPLVADVPHHPDAVVQPWRESVRGNSP